MTTAASVAIVVVALHVAITRKHSPHDDPPHIQPLDFAKPKELITPSPPQLTKQHVLRILDDISRRMTHVVSQLTDFEARIREEAVQSGRIFTGEELAEYLAEQFEQAMVTVEREVYATFRTTESEVNYAIRKFQSEQDTEVLDALARTQELHRAMSGGNYSDVEIPGDLTLSKVKSIFWWNMLLVLVMEETMEALNVAMEQVCLEVAALCVDDKEEAIGERYGKRADDVSLKIQKKYGLSRLVLQAAIAKFQHDARFMNAMSALQQEQADRFAVASSIFDEDSIA
ncbi:TPA: hypothetical protein N0F65_001252 [Lagenidium giganteum]|uniref:Uncharacterized protein n=1 Tax=Lagenidium giganteum TaxID=4803 RepID=A0AAV2YTF0_9STRA|nr:TPA: hypothetical protein N0F65_001252 [Lagenidium giganteum]